MSDIDQAFPSFTGGTRIIPLTKGEFTLVDGLDYNRLSQFKWYAQRSGRGKPDYYAARCLIEDGQKTTILMHRLILDAPDNVLVDHKNRDRLDNVRKNLRLCSVSQNQYNRVPNEGCASKYKGVSWSKRHLKWRARIERDGKQVGLGYFSNEADAARAYDTAAISNYGEFALTNKQLGLLQ